MSEANAAAFFNAVRWMANVAMRLNLYGGVRLRFIPPYDGVDNRTATTARHKEYGGTLMPINFNLNSTPPE
ncbi:MAG: hypothetical protein OEQ39_06560 [Gammaproteobacteria bacterium]|nr:hypothetical protein [Gammaproteobacteria bacterium]MDH3468092.1 hypothetical protein [Gammaproteobacteria bacterium]